MSTVELLAPGEAGPDNPIWHELRRTAVSASEIAAVLGISPWESPFSLYWRKVNGWQVEATDQMSTGTRLEPAIADWWADTHPEFVVRPAGLYGHSERPWQLATPDRLVLAFVRPAVTELAALLECKWTGSWDGWGDEGTDDIPVYYRAQGLQQADVLEVDEVHFAVLGPGGFRAYLVRRDEADLRVMRTAGAAFATRLIEDNPPDVDEHSATLAALKRLHPELVDEEAEISPATAAGYRRARALKAAAGRLADRFEARLRAEMRDRRVAVHDGVKLASRSIYDTTRLDTTRLKAEQPEVAAAYATTSTTDRLTPARSKK